MHFDVGVTRSTHPEGAIDRIHALTDVEGLEVADCLYKITVIKDSRQ